ncbi:MAG: hypothetical protein ACREF9_02320 [Opitutaceae bacterium]
MNPERMVFVYNADSGLFNAVIAWSHKLISPQTYQCSLCRSTFGLTGMLVPWKIFLQMLPFPSTFLHRDEFGPRYPNLAAMPLPLILIERNGESEILIAAGEIKETGGLAGLIGLVQIRLEEWAAAKADNIRREGRST